MMKVSIITVCYNAEKTIKKTIESVIKQSYSNIEYIIVDGGSKDGTLDIVETYKNMIENEKRFCGKSMTIISEPDNGIYDAMNKGIEMSNGELIGIINADDWYENDAIVTVVQNYDKHNRECIIYGGINVWNESNISTSVMPSELKCLEYQMAFGHPSCFVGAELYRRYGKYKTEYKIIADYVFINTCYAKNVNFVKVNKVLANFLVGGISTTEKKLLCKEHIKYLSETIRNSKDITERIERVFDSRFKCYYGKAIANLINKSCALFGAGVNGKIFIEECKKANIGVDYIVDNDSTKWGRTIDKPDILVGYKGNVFISTYKEVSNIIKQLNQIAGEEIKIITLTELKKEMLRVACEEDKELNRYVEKILSECRNRSIEK